MSYLLLARNDDIHRSFILSVLYDEYMRILLLLTKLYSLSKHAYVLSCLLFDYFMYNRGRMIAYEGEI